MALAARSSSDSTTTNPSSWQSCNFCSQPAIKERVHCAQAQGGHCVTGSLEYHQKMCVGSRHTCSGCYRPFRDDADLRRHLCPTNSHICCDICGKLIRPKGFRQHMKVSSMQSSHISMKWWEIERNFGGHLNSENLIQCTSYSKDPPWAFDLGN